MFSKELFGQRLKEARIKAGDTQGELGTLLNVNKSRICEMEKGLQTTTTEKLSKLCEHYHVSADYLLGLTDDPKPYGRKTGEQTG